MNSELKEQLEMPEEIGISIMQIAKQARKEGGQKLFHILRQGENEVYTAGEVGYTTERFGGAGKALSGSDAGGGTVE